jgi:hypothetical protein
METNMELNEVVKRSFELLDKILTESIASKNDDNMQTSFVYRHANNIFRLGKDTFFLLESGRAYSCPIVVRGMFESLFKLVAALKVSDAAVQIIISELEEDRDRMTKWLDPAVYAPIAEDFSNQILHLRKEFGITSTKTWNTLACAEAAQFGGHYRDAYFHLSSHSHAKVIGMQIQEKEACAGYCLQITIYAVLTAAGYLVQIVQTNSPQENMKECERLDDERIRLINSGVFIKMDQSEEDFQK